MITTAVILDAGKGTKLWPYAQIRSKGMVPICNKPVMRHLVDALKNLGLKEIIIVGGAHAAGARNHFRNDGEVRVIEDKNPKGPVFSLCAAKEYIAGDFLALFGDTLVTEGDLKALAEASSLPAVLASPLHGRSNDCITCNVRGDRATGFVGHPRGDSNGHFSAGFAFKKEHLALLETNAGRFMLTQVGMMPPLEGFIEMSLNDFIADGGEIAAIVTKDHTVDIDKPWHIYEAEMACKQRLFSAFEGNRLAEGASIDSSVILNGRVILGRNSRIRRGAIIHGDCVIGDDTTIENGCYLDDSSVGNRCYIGHGAELGGIIWDKVYLYHYMEINGIVGDNVDFGAATVCGSLRFDDGVTRHRIKGRLEEQHEAQDACFIGDYCRTGVNAILMPGVKTGVYSVVGAGVILREDVPDNTLIYAEQTHVKKAWGPEMYGW
ncbi:MAG: NDP-sugar synthase [Firmicutes bacterium]|nr:NDP-sugar synthase [Bacillota bacterium]